MTATAATEWTGDAGVDAVFDAVADSASEIREALVERRAVLDRENPSGDTISAADEYADDLLAERLLDVDSVAAYASEERDAVLTDDGRYHLAVDPLDGSSNLRPNNCMGTIVGVYDAPLPASGRDLVAAAYVLFGPNTTMVVADGETVTEYLLADGQRRPLRADLTVPDETTVYGFGGRRPDWTGPVESVVSEFEAERLKLRYGGALIGDFTQVLTHGGIFAYPELDDSPEGKLRYLFECAPMGFVMESAGGRVSDGRGDLLAREPDDLHARTPLYVGTTDLVDRVEAELA